MSKDLKTRGWQQGLYETSTTRKHVVGETRMTFDGRVFKYAKAGSSNISAGKLNVAAAINAHHIDATPTAAIAVGDKVIQLTVTDGTALAENQLKGGWLQINDGTGQGEAYPIESNAALGSSDTTLYLSLGEPMRTALAASNANELTVVHNPHYAVVESTTQASRPTGVPLVDVTAAYYFWNQVWGEANVLMDGTPAIGSQLTIGAVSGAVKVQATAYVQPLVGEKIGNAGVDTEYKPVFLKIG